MMIDRDIVLAKVASIDRCIKRIDAVTQRKPESLTNQDTIDIYVLNLQRAVQAAIDLANHVVSARTLGLPASLKESFALLEQGGLLSHELALKMQRMVGFRNIAVHDY